MLPVNDGLSLEYKLMQGTALRNLDVSDLLNNPLIEGKVWISGLGLKEELFSFLNRNASALRDDLTEAPLVGLDAV